jgi:CRP-like cAMP-binding protein
MSASTAWRSETLASSRAARNSCKPATVRALFVLLSGNAEVRRGDGVVLARLVSGDIFGEMSFIRNERASADVVAMTDVSVLTLTEAVINELFEERPGLAAGLYRSLAAELAHRLGTASAR